MITTALSVQIECLASADIHHDAFIGPDENEIQLWDDKRLPETLMLLASRGIKFDRIEAKGDPGEEFYLIYF